MTGLEAAGRVAHITRATIRYGQSNPDEVSDLPAAAVEPAGVVLELVQHLLHFEGRRDRLQKSGSPERMVARKNKHSPTMPYQTASGW